ncbi:hypothetical protein F4814DRAFT_245345 [Daldinia grandis]|nr:hypothetical protein F4814DRAFT_245345 [Daldinia grandis]
MTCSHVHCSHLASQVNYCSRPVSSQACSTVVMSGTVRISHPFMKTKHLSNDSTRPPENAVLPAGTRVKKSGSYPDGTVHTAELTLPKSNNLQHGPTAGLCSALRNDYHNIISQFLSLHALSGITNQF